MKMTTNSILVSIVNYNFSDNADLLKNNFSQFSVFDVCVDLRENSPTYKQHFGLTLSYDKALYIPPYCGHG